MITDNLKLLLNKLNRYCLSKLDNAAGYSMTRAHYEIGCEHILIKCLEDDSGDIPLLLKSMAIDRADAERMLLDALDAYRTGNSSRPAFSALLLDWFEQAWILASVEFGESIIRSGHLLLVLLTPSWRKTNSWIGDAFPGATKEKAAALLSAGLDDSSEEIRADDGQSKMPPEGMEALQRFTENLDAESPGRKGGSGFCEGFGDPADHRHPLSPKKEQSHPRGGSRNGQDRHCRRPGSEGRGRGGAAQLPGCGHPCPGYGASSRRAQASRGPSRNA